MGYRPDEAPPAAGLPDHRGDQPPLLPGAAGQGGFRRADWPYVHPLPGKGADGPPLHRRQPQRQRRFGPPLPDHPGRRLPSLLPGHPGEVQKCHQRHRQPPVADAVQPPPEPDDLRANRGWLPPGFLPAHPPAGVWQGRKNPAADGGDQKGQQGGFCPVPPGGAGDHRGSQHPLRCAGEAPPRV